MAKEEKFSNASYLVDPCCPKCGSLNVVEHKSKKSSYIKDPNGPNIYHLKRVECADCKYSWNEMYKGLGAADLENEQLVLNSTLKLFQDVNARLVDAEEAGKTSELTKTSGGALCCSNCGENTSLIQCLPIGLGDYAMMEFKKEGEGIYVLLCKKCGHAFAVKSTPTKLVVKHPKVAPVTYGGYSSGYGGYSGGSTYSPPAKAPFKNGCGSDLSRKVEGNLGSCIDSVRSGLTNDDGSSKDFEDEMPKVCKDLRRDCDTCDLPNRNVILPIGCPCESIDFDTSQNNRKSVLDDVDDDELTSGMRRVPR